MTACITIVRLTEPASQAQLVLHVELIGPLQVQVVPEPVDKWQDIGDGHHNVLKAFYETPERFAYTFQNYVFVTRMMQVRLQDPDMLYAVCVVTCNDCSKYIGCCTSWHRAQLWETDPLNQ